MGLQKRRKEQVFFGLLLISPDKTKMHYVLANSIFALLQFFLLFLRPINYNGDAQFQDTLKAWCLFLYIKTSKIFIIILLNDLDLSVLLDTNYNIAETTLH